MFRKLRLRRIHSRFLESSRNLKEGRDYWKGIGPVRRWLLETIIPVPILGLHQDGQLLHSALQWLEKNCRKSALNEEIIRTYHRMICPHEGMAPGEYRTRHTSVQGSALKRPDAHKIPALMKQLDVKIANEQRDLDAGPRIDEHHVLQAAVEAHRRIAFIHPFIEANGRVARLAMNHVLRRYGCGYVVLPPISECPEHFEALEEAHRGKNDRLTSLARTHYYQV